MATKEAAMTVALSDYTSSFYLVRRADGWHYGSSRFYQLQKPGSKFTLDSALEWERYENGQLVETSHDVQGTYPGSPADGWLSYDATPYGVIVGEEPEPLWWQQERTEASRKRDQLIALRRSIRCMLIGG